MIKRMSFVCAAWAMAIGVACVSARGQGYTADFNALAPGNVVGQNGWIQRGTWSSSKVAPGAGFDGSTAISNGAADTCGAAKQFAAPFLYNASNRSVVWEFKGRISQTSDSLCLAGTVLDSANEIPVLFGFLRTAVTGNVLKTGLFGRLGEAYGDALVVGHWYHLQLAIDFGQPGGSATLRYRDLTAGTPFQTDGIIVNQPLGIPLSAGNYSIYGVVIRQDCVSHATNGVLLDDVALAAPAPGVTSFGTFSLQAKIDGLSGPAADLRIAFFDAPSGGTQVGTTITLSGVPVKGGIVSVPVPVADPTIFNGQTLHMEIAVDGMTISPRTVVTSVPYAMSAGTLATTALTILPNGKIGVGTLQPQETFDVNGRAVIRRGLDVRRADGSLGLNVDELSGATSVRVLTITGADVAEPFNVTTSDTAPEATPGMLVSIDPANPGKLVISSTPYDTKVAGAISGAGGLSVGVVMGKDNTDPLIKGDHPVAMSGRVYVWCDASAGPIEPGDMLTTSATPGHAMKAADQSRAFGAVIGKAMTPLESGKGLVLVLVNLQ